MNCWYKMVMSDVFGVVYPVVTLYRTIKGPKTKLDFNEHKYPVGLGEYTRPCSFHFHSNFSPFPPQSWEVYHKRIANCIHFLSSVIYLHRGKIHFRVPVIVLRAGGVWMNLFFKGCSLQKLHVYTDKLFYTITVRF